MQLVIVDYSYCTSFYNLKPTKQHVHGGEEEIEVGGWGILVCGRKAQRNCCSLAPFLYLCYLYIRLSGMPIVNVQQQIQS